MAGQSQQFGFFVENVGTAETAHRACGADGLMPWVPVPFSGFSCLLLGSDPLPRLLSDDSQRDLGDTVVLEKLRHEAQHYLMMLAPARRHLHVNGSPAGPVSILRLKDQVQVDENYVLHVSSFITPYIGPADPTDVRQECLICRTPILAKQTVYRCAYCELALHCGKADRPEHDRLECALTSTDCPRCRMAMVREEGYAYVPDV